MIYPKPSIPTLPILSFASFNHAERRHIPSVLDVGGAKFVTSGRVAIALALRQMKIGKNDKVLLPAYHCSSMVEPVIWADATPIFYKIGWDTSVDLDDIRTRLDSSTKLLLVTHYFGFPQNLAKIRSFCDENNIMLLEDCAHAFFGEYDGRPLGSFGDYAIASAMKFFPIYEGGCLVSSRHEIASLHLESAGPGFEMKVALNTLEKGFDYGRLKFLKNFIYLPMGFKDFIWNSIKKRVPSEKTTLGPGASDGGYEFETKWLSKQSSFISKYLIKQVSKNRIAIKRRENYIALQEALMGLPKCRPLFSDLPEGVIPYVFPLIADQPEKIIPVLKNAGVPVIRFGEFLWESVDARICPVSIDLSRTVLQFSCHQELRPEELKWMIAQIRNAFLSN